MKWRNKMIGKKFGPPPTKGPTPQGIRITMISIGSNPGILLQGK